MKKITLLSLLVLLIGATASASPVDPKTAQLVARNFMQKQTPSTASKLIWSEAQHPAGLQELYLFNCEPQGFVVVASDDVAMPILAYSVENTFPAKEIPDHVREWLEGYSAEIRYLQDNNIEQGTLSANEWQTLRQGDDFPLYSASAVEPLLTTKWSQDPYYNNLCPYDNYNGGTSVTGCVATAMAQLMKYWNHPSVGNGSHSYLLSGFGTISADFGSTTYDWANMPNMLSSTSSSRQVNAVATLMFHCGVSVEMSYAATASGAQVYMPRRGYAAVNWALLDYFDYSSDLQGVYKSQYSDSQWKQLLKTELDAQRPVLYAGFDSESGHAFVCDGYNSSDRFHFNWGWGGYYDGYFAIGALNPGGGGTGSNSTYTFNLNNVALIHVHPNSTLRVSPNEVTFGQTGGSSTVQVVANQTDSRWTASADQSWLTLSPTSGSGSGATSTLTITAAANNTGSNRTATVTVTQGTTQSSVSVVQYGCSTNDACDITIAMNDYYNDGWDGAELTISDANGFVYATAAATASSSTQYQTVSVCPGDVRFTWTAGSYDSECSFVVYDAAGNQKLRQSGAFTGSKSITDPCATASGFRVTANINDNAMGDVSGTGTFPAGTMDTIMAIANDGYRFVDWGEIEELNPFILNVQSNFTFSAIFANLGVDTLHYDNGNILTSLGGGSTDTFYWGIRFRPEDIGTHNLLKAVRVPDLSDAAGLYVVRIYQGGNDAPGTLIASKSETFTGVNSWRTIAFDTPLPIDNTQPIWIVVGHLGNSPAACATFAGNTAGSWYSIGGQVWHTLNQSGYFYTWMLRAIFDTDESLRCSARQLPYVQDFEDGMLCWTYESAISGTGNDRYFGRSRSSSTAHNSTYSFAFSSYYSSSNYNQYLISPELAFGTPTRLTLYYYAPYGNYKAEQFRILYSTTDDDLTSFTHQVRSVGVSTSSWQQLSVSIPAEARYVAINYYSNDKYFLYVDDIEFTADETPDEDQCAATAPWTETFTSSSPTVDCWMAYDMDGDGYSWRISPSSTMGYDDDGVASSASYVNNVGALTPDNCFVSPAVAIPNDGSTYYLHWVAAGYGRDYAEHYSVYVSTEPDDFDFDNPLFSLTVADQGYSAHGVSLADYAGQTIYIAFRHHDCTDQYMLFLDNVSVNTTPPDTTPDNPDDDDCAIATLPWTETFSNTSATTGCWHFFDLDGDGETWSISVNATAGYNDNGVAVSASYGDNGALTPDNMIVSPAITLPADSAATLSWAVAAYDETDYAEHYSVYASTSPTSNFNLLHTETLTTDSYFTRSVSLADFQGQTIYIAFRHHDCTNQYLLLIDDVTVSLTTTNPDDPEDPDECTITSLPWTETFAASSPTRTCWGADDDDEDNYSWAIISNTEVGYLDSGIAASSSMLNDGTVLTPDNWLYSPLIKMPSTGSYTLSWAAAALDQTLFAEHYSVYVYQEGATQMQRLFEETLAQPQRFFRRNINLDSYSLNGKNVYFIFRHHECSGQNMLLLDNVTLAASDTPNPSAINSIANIEARVYPNPTHDKITIDAEGLQRVEVYDAMGRLLIAESLNSISLHKLPRGTYTLRIITSHGIAISKVSKQ